jgi:hypothetical protein
LSEEILLFRRKFGSFGECFLKKFCHNNANLH